MPRVLIVDDDLGMRTLLRMALHGEGYTVATAQNGDEAVAFLLAAREPWVVLLDVNLPGCSGLDVCAELASANWSGKSHRVILMSANMVSATPLPPIVLETVKKPFGLDDILDRAS